MNNKTASIRTNQNESVFTISELAKEFDLTTRAIRFYESEGLISPHRTGRQRVYSLRDHTRLKLIIRGKRLGFSLMEIREMFELYDSEPGESAQLRLILNKIADRKMSLEQQLEDINIGIGGSDLGSRLAVDALQTFRTGDIEVEFVANLDPKDLSAVLARSNAETTMLIVASKSFTTLETRTNAEALKSWLTANGCSDLSRHIIAVTTNKTAALEFGASEDNIFYFWDWVGGRYSLWSSVGLPLAIAIGMDNFEDLLAGAHTIDTHFQSAPLTKNVPVILALLSIWYSNFHKAESHAVIPYDQSLRLLPEYLSQLVMESNGKSVSRNGQAIESTSSPILWGSIGTNAQHAYFQLLHQGTHLVPVDFLLPLLNSSDQQQQLKLVSNCLAQSEALMMGQDDDTDANRNFPGNSPSSTMVYSSLTPKVLGMLLAIYEHKTFVEAMIWDINPFDQWGVELGKKLAGQLIEDISVNETSGHDASTSLLMQEYLQRNK